MHVRALVAVVLCAFLAGFSGILIKAMSSLTATSIAWMRMTIPTLVLGVWMVFKGIPFFRGNVKVMLTASTLNAARMYLYFVAFIYTSIGNAIILFYTWPIFTALMGHTILKERFSTKQWGFLFMAFVGLVIAYSDKTFSFDDHDLVGMVAAVAGAFIYAITVIIFKSQTNNYSRSEILFYQNFMGLFIFLPFFYHQIPAAQMDDILLCIFYSIFIGLVVFNLFFYGLHHLKASVASSIMYLEIISAILASYFLLGDGLSISMIIGGVFILTGSFMIGRLVR